MQSQLPANNTIPSYPVRKHEFNLSDHPDMEITKSR